MPFFRSLLKRCELALFAVALTFAARPVLAQATWAQGASGNWNTTGNWSGLSGGDAFPGSSGTSYTVTIPGVTGQAGVNLVVFDNTTIPGNVITLSGLTLSSALNSSGSAAAALRIGSGVTLNAGSLSNFASNTLSGGSYNVSGIFKFAGANITTLGGGTNLVMSGSAAQLLNQTNNANALSGFLNNQGQFEITNGYNYNLNNGFQNSGVIRVTEGSTLLNNSSFTNSGSLVASGTGSSSTGIIRLTNGGVITQTGAGSITAGANGLVQLNYVTLTGGSINTINGGRITATTRNDNYLQDVALNGNIDLATDQGAITIKGTSGLTMNTGSTVDINNNSYLLFTENSALNGNGTVVFGNSTGNKIALNYANTTATIGSGVTIRGQNGSIGDYVTYGGADRVLVNNGTIAADVNGGTITLSSTDGFSLSNNNILEAKNGGTLTVSGAVNNSATGVMNASDNGTIMLDRTTVTGGTINTTSGGRFTTTNAYNDNNLQDVTLNGKIDLASDQRAITIKGTTGLTMNTGSTIDINNNSYLLFTENSALNGNGTVVFGNSTGNKIALNYANTTATIGSGVTIRGQNGSIGDYVTWSGADRVLVNNGTIAADVAGGTITIASSSGQFSLSNNNILEAKNGGTLRIQGPVNNSATGVMNASDNGIVSLDRTTITGGTINTTSGGRFTTTNAYNDNYLQDVTLNGKIDLASDQRAITIKGTTGLTMTAGSTVDINNNSTLLFTENSALNGNGTVVFGSSTGNKIALNNANTTATIGSGITIRGQNGSIGDYVTTGGADRVLVNNGTIVSDGGGTITIMPTSIVNNGTFRAQNGTLTLTQAVSGTGTLQTDAGGVLNMSSTGASTQDRLLMGAIGSTLNTANQNITINKDYTNIAAGTGNAFNRRAGINGTGQIMAGGDVAQIITGASITNGATTNATLTIGNVRVGSTDFNYQIANGGTTGADLRGALQTSVNGANITDSRLSGSGITEGNYGPIAVNSSSSNYTVNFTANTAGTLAPLSGQAINLRSNFENITDQKLNIVLSDDAAAYNAAVGATAASVNLGNSRVGGSLTGNLTITNAAPTGNFTEKLDAMFGAVTGDATNNGGSVSLLSAGSNNNSSMGVALNTSSAGARSGTVTVDYATNGTGTSGLSTESVGSQIVTVEGNVYQAAQGQLNSTPLNFGTVQVGQSVSKVLSISNIATGPTGFVEDLHASFGSTSGTGASLISGSGSINGLQAGATNNSAMTVSVNTAAAGSVAGNIAINYLSAGTVNGVSNGLGTLAVGSSQFGVNGTIQAVAQVVDQAAPVINTPSINLGNVRINSASPSAAVSVTNQATGNQQAALSASISGNGPITGNGAFNLLAPGATNSTSLLVGMNTSMAGQVSGTATLSLVSDASNIGDCAPYCQMALGSQDVSVSGTVYRLANPSVNNSPVNLVARVGDASPTASIAVTNVSPDAYTERLDASFGGATPAGFSTSGSIVGLAAQGSSNALQVALNTGTAGFFGGAATINLTSSGAGTTLAADEALGSSSVGLSGKVYQAAEGQLNTSAIDFGIVHVGDVITAQGVSVTNSATAAALNDVLMGDITGANSPFILNGTLGSGTAAGSTDNSSLTVGMNTASAGVYNSSATVNFRSHNDDMADLSLGSDNVLLSGTVNNYAVATLIKTLGIGSFSFINNEFVLDFGSVTQGTGGLAAYLGVMNDITGPADYLNGSFNLGLASAFSLSGFDAFADLAGGDVFGGLGVLFNTADLGAFSQTITLASFGTNASGYEGSESDLQLTLRGNVVGRPPVGVPEPGSTALIIVGLVAGLITAKHRSTQLNSAKRSY